MMHIIKQFLDFKHNLPNEIKLTYVGAITTLTDDGEHIDSVVIHYCNRGMEFFPEIKLPLGTKKEEKNWVLNFIRMWFIYNTGTYIKPERFSQMY